MPLSGKPEVDTPKNDRIQIALLLDTSNSMDGLIDQTRTQLWKVVNTFISARRDGSAPHVEVALFEYGNNSLHAGNHYIRLVEPLSRDMDELSRELFELKTNDGAALAGGRYVIIDQNRAVPHVDTPQDAEIARLGVRLNEIYLGYGKSWGKSAERQVKADNDAVANWAAGAAVQRMVCKASHNYSNTKWDLVDAVKDLEVDPASIPAGELPEEMRKMDATARVDHVKKAASKRAEIQAQIVRRNREREAFLAEARKKSVEAGAQTLDDALILVVREQAKALGYEFDQ